MKKIFSLVLALVLAFSLTACGNGSESEGNPDETKGAKTAADLKIGIIQLAEHPALDAACNSFVATLTENGFSQDNIDVQNAQGEQSNCTPIVNKFINNKVDLILAIATPAAQAAAQATKEIPILVTAVTDPAASGLVESNEKPGGNVSGTSDMNPIADQIALVKKFAPEAAITGVLYCSSEPNSKIQADIAMEEIKAAGMEAKEYTVSETSEINAVITKITQECDALYIPTDNLFASNMGAVSQVAAPAGLPVICGEQNMVMQGGVATYGLSYEELGKLTAQQAMKILLEGASIADMPIGYSPKESLTLTINEEIAAQTGVEIPADMK